MRLNLKMFSKIFSLVPVFVGYTVGWDTALQVGTSRGSIPDGVGGIFRWQSFRPHYGPGV